MQEFELRSDFAREVLDESERVPVLVDFWAPWCGPCRILSPILEKLVREAAGAWKLVTVNADENTDLSEVLRIQSIPTVFLFSHGQPIATFSGALPEKDLREWLRRYIPAPAEKAGVEEAGVFRKALGHSQSQKEGTAAQAHEAGAQGVDDEELLTPTFEHQ